MHRNRHHPLRPFKFHFGESERLLGNLFGAGSHALLTKIVLAWNTGRMHEVIERLKRDGTRIEDDWLRRIGPAHLAHVNFRGTMRFGVEKYADATSVTMSLHP